MRCSILHQGSANPDTGIGRPVGPVPAPKKSQYASISFVDPDHAPPFWHRHVEANPGGTLDIAQMADEMVSAMRDWFEHVATHPALIEQVIQNLPQQNLGRPLEVRTRLAADRRPVNCRSAQQGGLCTMARRPKKLTAAGIDF